MPQIFDRAEYFQGKDKQWYVRLVSSGNHARIFTSEGYVDRADAERVAYDAGVPVRAIPSDDDDE